MMHQLYLIHQPYQCYEMVLVSLKPASIMCTLASELGDMTSCTKSGLESNPKPRGTDIDTAGRASSVFDITAVARLCVCI